MSEEKMPYEAAITETAKATSNLVDLVREGGRAAAPALGDLYGLLLGDRIEALRWRNLDKLTRETKKLFQERDLETPQAPPESISVPLLEAVQGEPRDEMIALWARLLVNAMDPKRANDVRPDYISILKRLEPIDALVFDRLGKERKPVDYTQLVADLRRRESAVVVSLRHLGELKVTEIHGSPSTYKLTPLGQELMVALAP